MTTGSFVIATPEQLEEAYERAAKQFGLLLPKERVMLWPRLQAIVWIEPKSRAHV